MDLSLFYPSSQEIFSFGNIFLILVAIFWMAISSIQDFKKREVENWWNFSLIVLVLAFRVFFSIENHNYLYILWGLIGLAAGFVLANIFYYGRMFAGGDAKLLMALGAILPLSLDWRINLFLFIAFIILFLICGSVYGLVFSFILALKNFKIFRKEFAKNFNKYKKGLLILEALLIILAIIFSVYGFYLGTWLVFILILTPLLFIYAHSVENCCMQSLVSVKNLTIGDWIVKPIKAGKKLIKPNWEGLSESELYAIRKHIKSKVLVKSGIPFVPSFLLGFLVLLYLIKFYF